MSKAENNVLPSGYHPKSFWERNKRSHGYLLQREIRSKAYKLFRFLLLFAICFLILHPILDKLSVSLMEERDLYDSTITSIPKHLTLDNYRITSEQIYYPRALLNTLWISLLVSVLQVASCTLVAYGFARFDFPLISPLLIVNIIYSVIDFFMKTDNRIMSKINDTMVINMDYGFASAMAWIYFAVVIVIISISSLIVSKGVVGSYE